MQNNITLIQLLIVTILGLVIGSFIQINSTSISPKLPETTFKVPYDVFSNPAIDSLFANVEGTVVAKQPDSMSLEKNGKRITIYIAEKTGLTTFRQLTKTTNDTLTYSDIQVGDSLSGGISVITTLRSANSQNPKRAVGDLIGHRFLVTRK